MVDTAEVTNPEARLAEDVKLSDEDVTQWCNNVTGAVQARNIWERKLREWYNRSYGIRPEKNFPWPKCSNLNLPLTDSRIKSAKPQYVRAVFNITPIATFEPLAGEDPEKAHRVEGLYDWLVRVRMRESRKKIKHLVDGMHRYGFGLMACTWKYQTERVTRKLDMSGFPQKIREQVAVEEIEQAAITQLGLNPERPDDVKAIRSVVEQFQSGADPIEVSLQKVVYDAPEWRYVPCYDIIVPWDSFDDIERLPWIAEVIHMRPQELKDEAAAGKYDKKLVKEICDSHYAKRGAGGDSSRVREQLSVMERDKAIREGLTREEASPNYVNVIRIYCWRDINGDDLDERVVLDIHLDSKKLLRAVEYPYDHGEWPYTKYNLEETEDRWYCPRGIPELLWDLQDELNATHNMWIDRQVLTNAMPFKYRKDSLVNPSKSKPMPGAGIEVKRMEDLEPITMQLLDFTFDGQERVLKAWADEYTGNPGLAFNNIVNRVERRTAREVEAIGSGSEGIASDDIAGFQDSMARLHWQTLRLWKQYGAESVEVRLNPKGMPITVSRLDLDGRFDLVPTGNQENSNPHVLKQQLLNDMSVAANPLYAKYANHWEMFRDYLEMSNLRRSVRYLRAPGLFEQDAAQEQFAEIIFMQAVRQPADVNTTDAHDVHVAAIERAMPAQQQRDPELAQLMTAHALMHMIAMGQLKLGDPSLAQLPWEFAIVGNRVQALPKGVNA